MTEVKRCFDIDKETARVEERGEVGKERMELSEMYNYAEKINKKFKEELKAKGGKI